MATIAYVDHSFHQTTRSTDFLPQILRRRGHTVDCFWDHAWQGGAPVRWTDVSAHDVVIMFQSYCPIEGGNFRQLHRNVIYIPMLDQFGIYRGPLFNLSAFWEPFRGSKVLNFSNAAHCMTLGFGIASHFVRYYQPVAKVACSAQQGLHGFFWLRRETELPWRVIRQLIAGTRFDSLHIHLATDPGTPAAQLPSNEDAARHNITTSTWFEDKADLDALIVKANVYFAPRLEEGIGQSFLEAMGRGQCVVAANHGTMNEYILPGVNGLLFDASAPQPLDFSDVAALGACARAGSLAGRSAWEKAEDALLDFILTPSEALYDGKYQHTFGLTNSASAALDANPQGGWLRRISQSYGFFRATRFIWHPCVQLGRRIRGR